MALTNMKIPRGLRKKDTATVPEVAQEEYPYGLRITLEKEQLKQLGCDVRDFNIGENLSLKCLGEVTGVSTTKRLEGEDWKTVNIQITKLSFDEKK